MEGSLKLNRGGRGTLKHLAPQTNMKQKGELNRGCRGTLKHLAPQTNVKQKGELNRGERGTLKHLVSPDKNEIERKGKQSKGTCTCYRHVVQNRKVR